MVPAGNKAKHLSSVNHTTKTNHHHHHHHQEGTNILQNATYVQGLNLEIIKIALQKNLSVVRKIAHCRLKSPWVL